MAKKEAFDKNYGDSDFLTPLDSPRKGKEPGPSELVINVKQVPDPLGLCSPIPSSPLRRPKGA